MKTTSVTGYVRRVAPCEDSQCVTGRPFIVSVDTREGLCVLHAFEAMARHVNHLRRLQREGVRLTVRVYAVRGGISYGYLDGAQLVRIVT